MSNLYPLFFEPVLKHYLWGGRNLEMFGRELPINKPVSESWEISGHEDGKTIVKNGIYAGKTLDQLLAILGTELVGRNNKWALQRNKFPLLIKLLDADRRLSVQVHPDDAYARKFEGNELGKAEMWVVLWAKHGAEIVYGFSENITPDVFRQALESGSVDNYLQFLPVKAGDHICVPPGTLHAILEGVLIAEIQQNSNTTYRVFDWNRNDQDGQPRALHIEKALEVVNYEQVDEILPKPKTLQRTDRVIHERLCKNAYFTTERITLNKEEVFIGDCNGTSLEIWGVISGQASINGVLVEGVQFFLLPAGMGKFSINAEPDCVLLRTYNESK